MESPKIITKLVCLFMLLPAVTTHATALETHWMIPMRKYLLLSGSERIEYTLKLRHEYLEFEKSQMDQKRSSRGLACSTRLTQSNPNFFHYGGCRFGRNLRRGRSLSPAGARSLSHLREVVRLRR